MKAPYFARKREFFVQTSPYWALRDLRDVPDGTGPPVQPCPLLRGASWLEPPDKKKRKRTDDEQLAPSLLEVSEVPDLDDPELSGASMPDAMQAVLAHARNGGNDSGDAFEFLPAYIPSYDTDQQLDSLSDVGDVDVEELQEQIGSIFQGTDELLFDPSLNGTILLGELSRQNSSRGLKRQASACEPDDVEDGAALVRTSSSRQRAQKAWAILRRQVSDDVAKVAAGNSM